MENFGFRRKKSSKRKNAALQSGKFLPASLLFSKQGKGSSLATRSGKFLRFNFEK